MLTASRILQESTVVSNHVIHDIYSGFDGIGHQVHETRQAIDSLLKEKVDEGQNTNVARSEEYIARNVCGEASDELKGIFLRDCKSVSYLVFSQLIVLRVFGGSLGMLKHLSGGSAFLGIIQFPKGP